MSSISSIGQEWPATYITPHTAVYEMQLKDAAAQIILWKNLNAIMARHGVFAPKVKTLMGDSAKAN
jgi:hypothetical protein